MTAIERITPGVRLILTLVLVGWVWRAFSPVLGAGEWLADFPQAVLHGQLWRLVTYPFAVGLNSSTLIGTICFAPFAIIVERDLGSVRFQRLFWGSTLLSSILGLLVSALRPEVVLFGLTVPTLAVATAFCLLNWKQTVYLMLVLPVKVKYVIPLMSLGVLTTPPVQWLPLFSSMGLAYLMVKRNWLMQTQIFAKQARARRRSRLSEDFKGPKVTPIRPNLTRVALTEVETQVDKILDKLRSEGMASLTTQEKEVLDSHSKRLRHGDERL